MRCLVDDFWYDSNTYYSITFGVLMKTSGVTTKGQATIPAEIRKKLDLHPGDKVGFKVKNDEVIVYKIKPFDYEHHQALAKTLSEWDSKEDEEAYRDL